MKPQDLEQLAHYLIGYVLLNPEEAGRLLEGIPWAEVTDPHVLTVATWIEEQAKRGHLGQFPDLLVTHSEAARAADVWMTEAGERVLDADDLKAKLGDQLWRAKGRRSAATIARAFANPTDDPIEVASRTIEELIQTRPGGEPPLAARDSIRPVAVPLSTIATQSIDWMWPGYLARGQLHTLAGAPGAGKSTLLRAIATAITRGDSLPGDETTRPPGTVLFLATEDDVARGVRPDLEAMGADLDRILVRAGIQEGDQWRPPVLPDDRLLIDALVAERRPDVVIVDTLVALQNPILDAHQQTKQRSVLAPLQRVAETHDCAVIIVAHTRKAPVTDANHAVMGSTDLVALSRVVWQVANDPADPNRRVVIVTKTNLGTWPDARRFDRIQGRFGWDPHPASDVTRESLVAPAESAEDRSAADEARAFLADALGSGPVATADLKAQAKAAGIAWRTIERVERAMGIQPFRNRDVERAPWSWSLPSPPTPP